MYGLNKVTGRAHDLQTGASPTLNLYLICSSSSSSYEFRSLMSQFSHSLPVCKVTVYVHPVYLFILILRGSNYYCYYLKGELVAQITKITEYLLTTLS